MSEKSKPKSHEDLTPSSLWAMYTQCPFPHELVDLPVGEKFKLAGALTQIAMVPISMEDRMLCQAEADDYTRKVILKNPPKEGEENRAYGSIYDADLTVRVLWRACRDPNDESLKKKVFPGPLPMRQNLTPDQITILAHHYMRVERLLSPIQSIMSKDEMDGFLMRLREGGRAVAPLDYLSSELLKDLLLHSVSTQPKSPTPSTSPGSPPDENETPQGLPAPEEPAPEGSNFEELSSEGSAPTEPKPKLVLG